MVMIRQLDPPRQQLRKSPGQDPGYRNMFPVDYRDVANTPDVGALLDHPILLPRKYISYYHEGTTTNTGREWSLTNTGIGSGVAVLTGERNGAIQLASGTSDSGYTVYAVGSQTVLPFVNVRNPYMEIRAVLTTNLGTAATRHIGFWNDITAATPADGIGFRTLGSTANWFAVTRASSAETTSNTGIAAATGTWYLFVIKTWAKGTKVSFEMWSDASPRVRVFGPVVHTANIPTVGLAGGMRTMNPTPAEGATRDIAFDYQWLYQLRQTPP